MINPIPLPEFTLQPSSQMIGEYDGLIFRANAVGISTPVQYQWQFNGTNIPSATNGVLIIDSVAPFHAGAYTVVASTVEGSQRISESANQPI